MNQTTKAKTRSAPDWVLAGTTLALIAIGLMMVYSSTFAMGYRNFNEGSYYFERQLLWSGIGMVGLVAMALINYRHLTKVSILGLLVTIGLLIAVVIVNKGEGRHLFGDSVSPVELAKLALIVYIAHWLASKKADQLRKLPVGLLPFTIIVGVVAALVMAQPDISEAIVIVLVAVAMFFLAGADLMQFAVGIAGGIAAFFLVVRNMESAMERLAPFKEAWGNPLVSSNFQLKQGIIAIGSGGLLGLGPGNGRMSHQWLPAAYTDSIFAIVGEELGLLGCLLLILLFALIAYKGFMLVRRTRDPFGRLLAAGISCWISFQALINLAVVTNTIPFTGIALPFISLGGSSLISCMIGSGILLSISREPIGVEAPDSETAGVRWRDGRTRLPRPLSN
ncbi:MAG TPA: FtsW/RodA/SpoVE family cell cycle protein [Anaerolineae bacterium]|nr:FtsW/RodA/SpoVE family cell cycle protein [Anaerolineae bacterium]